MKHNKRFSRLSRDCSHRIALVKNLTRCLLLYKNINTTKAKSESVLYHCNRVINKIHKCQNLKSKCDIIKKYIINQNRSEVTKILNFVNTITLKSNHISRLRLYNNKFLDRVNLKII